MGVSMISSVAELYLSPSARAPVSVSYRMPGMASNRDCVRTYDPAHWLRTVHACKPWRNRALISWALICMVSISLDWKRLIRQFGWLIRVAMPSGGGDQVTSSLGRTSVRSDVGSLSTISLDNFWCSLRHMDTNHVSQPAEPLSMCGRQR